MSNPEEDNQEPFPEMLIISNIIDRICAYLTENPGGIRLAITVDLKTKNEKEISENYAVSASPINAETDEEYNQISDDCIQMITEEFSALYPQEVTPLKIPIQDVDSIEDLPEHARKHLEMLGHAKYAEREKEPEPEKEEKPSPGSTFMRFDERA